MDQLNALKGIFKACEVLDSESNWFYLNRIWHKPEPRNEFYNLFKDFWEENLPKNNLLVIVPEGISSSFGILPIVSSLVSVKNYSMVIWKEFGDILTTEPYLFPEKQYLEKLGDFNASCIIVQDVINQGTTLVKMQKQLEQLGLKISRYVGVIQFLQDVDKLEDNLSELGGILEKGFTAEKNVIVMAGVDPDNKLRRIQRTKKNKNGEGERVDELGMA